jgi:hypothetical protein
VQDDSDRVPLGGPEQPPLTDAERRAVRRLIKDDEHATWLRKQVRVFTPWLIAVVTALYAFFNWVQSHWKAN